MEVKINREIRNYTESMFFGLSLRQFVFSLLAVGVAVLLYFVLKPYVGTETVSWMCILGAAPFAAMGFVNYNGMTAEQFVWAWFRERGQWADNAMEPSPGMIIFFDWDNRGSSGPQDGQADHVGIVQKVENGVVYTIEGNSGDSCRVNQYPLGYYEILGYGVVAY